jgi:Gluconate 2-dehydrogenase subunit 3
MYEMHNLDRRMLLQRALLLLGAASTGMAPPALAKAAGTAKPYLDAQTFDVLSAVADTLIPRTETPGAVDVRVPALFDALLINWASGQRRYELTQALAKVDRITVAQHGKRFAELPAATREIVLKAHEAEAMKVLPNAGNSGVKSLLAGPAYADPGYGKLKELIVLLYYVSEPALTQELSYVHAPGAWRPSIPVTPDTRPAAGGLF